MVWTQTTWSKLRTGDMISREQPYNKSHIIKQSIKVDGFEIATFSYMVKTKK